MCLQDGSAAPDVWQQLLKCCTAEPEGQPTPGCALTFCVEALAMLQERMSKQEQAEPEGAAGLQEDSPAQDQVVAGPIAGLHVLQQLHEVVQQLLPSNQH
jgi:hypothetical protein